MKLPVLNYGGKQMHFNYVWLRDHCCSSYNSMTNQRNVDTGTIDLAIRPDNASVQDGNLLLTCKSVINRDGHRCSICLSVWSIYLAAGIPSNEEINNTLVD